MCSLKPHLKQSLQRAFAYYQGHYWAAVVFVWTDPTKSAIKILAGTLYVLTRELDDAILTNRERTMTFTCFVLFDMFNAMACRSQRKSITQLAHNHTLYIAIGKLS